MDWAIDELATIDLGDKRLNNRAQSVLSCLGSKPTASIPAACKGWHETKATYRLLSNPNVTSEGILTPHWDCTLQRMSQEPLVLCLEDTTELDLYRQNRY